MVSACSLFTIQAQLSAKSSHGFQLSAMESTALEDGSTFTAYTIEGVEMTFQVLSSVDCTCQVGISETEFTSPSISPATSGIVTIPQTANGFTVVSISNYAFAMCDQLTHVVIPNSIKSMGEQVFGGCNRLSFVSSEIEEPFDIDEYSFFRLINDEVYPVSVDILVPPKTKEKYLSAAGWKTHNIFEGFIARTIEDIDMVFSVTDNDNKTCMVGQNSFSLSAFIGSPSGKVTIPSKVNDYTVTAIGQRAFRHCETITDVSISNSVTFIGESAFSGCSGLTSVTIPNSLTSIEEWTFGGCTSLTSVTWPNSLKNIGSAAFRECAFKNLSIPSSVECVDDYAFCRCKSLASVTIPNSVVTLGEGVFSGCTSLANIKSMIEKPYGLGDYFFENINASATLYVPYGTKALYEATSGWNSIENIVEMEIETTDISKMDNAIYLDDAEAIADDGRATLVVKMKNNVVAEGFHFDLYLPEGCSFALNEEGKLDVELSTERTNSSNTNKFNFDLNEDGSLNVDAYSSKGKTINGEDGPVVLVRIIVDKGTAEVLHPIVLKNWGVTDNMGTVWPKGNDDPLVCKLNVVDLIRGDANGDGTKTINSGDFVTIVHHILNLPYSNLNKTSADANGDGRIDVGDLTSMSNLKKYGTIYRPNSSVRQFSPKVSNLKAE